MIFVVDMSMYCASMAAIKDSFIASYAYQVNKSTCLPSSQSSRCVCESLFSSSSCVKTDSIREGFHGDFNAKHYEMLASA